MIIETMPTLFGHQFYPSGFPLPADKISISGRTVLDIFLSQTLDDPNEEDEKILTDYYRYYMLCPLWCAYTMIDEEKIMQANRNELFDICLEMGIDPI